MNYGLLAVENIIRLNIELHPNSEQWFENFTAIDHRFISSQQNPRLTGEYFYGDQSFIQSQFITLNA